MDLSSITRIINDDLSGVGHDKDFVIGMIERVVLHVNELERNRDKILEEVDCDHRAQIEKLEQMNRLLLFAEVGYHEKVKELEKDNEELKQEIEELSEGDFVDQQLEIGGIEMTLSELVEKYEKLNEENAELEKRWEEHTDDIVETYFANSGNADITQKELDKLKKDNEEKARLIHEFLKLNEENKKLKETVKMSFITGLRAGENMRDNWSGSEDEDESEEEEELPCSCCGQLFGAEVEPCKDCNPSTDDSDDSDYSTESDDEEDECGTCGQVKGEKGSGCRDCCPSSDEEDEEYMEEALLELTNDRGVGWAEKICPQIATYIINSTRKRLASTNK